MNFNDLASSELTSKDIDFVCDHDSGKLWVLHGKPLPNQKRLSRARFDSITGQITFMSHDNNTTILPVTVKAPLIDPFSNGKSVTVVWTDKGDIFDLHVLPLETL